MLAIRRGSDQPGCCSRAFAAAEKRLISFG